MSGLYTDPWIGSRGEEADRKGGIRARQATGDRRQAKSSRRNKEPPKKKKKEKKSDIKLKKGM